MAHAHNFLMAYRTVPHGKSGHVGNGRVIANFPAESVIDSILHPELRDRMILLRGKPIHNGGSWQVFWSLTQHLLHVGRFDLVDCLHDYRTAITIHGDDVLAHGNWEISEQWLSRYKYGFPIYLVLLLY